MDAVGFHFAGKNIECRFTFPHRNNGRGRKTPEGGIVSALLPDFPTAVSQRTESVQENVPSGVSEGVGVTIGVGVGVTSGITVGDGVACAAKGVTDGVTCGVGEAVLSGIGEGVAAGVGEMTGGVSVRTGEWF